jgi:hypothetical protein
VTVPPPPLATSPHLRFSHRLLELFDLLVVVRLERLLHFDRGIEDRRRGDVQVGC